MILIPIIVGGRFMFTVQLVDDEPIVRKGLNKLIGWEELGFEVVCEAENGEEALVQQATQKIDVMITDIGMPIMNGIELMKEARKSGYLGEIVILTAYGEFEYAKSAIQYGVTDYILKPIEEEQIIETLNKIKEKLLKKLESENRYKSHDIKIENSKERVFSRENDKLLIKYIMGINSKALEVLEKIVEEERELGEGHISSMCMRFSYILEELVSRVKEKYIYLTKLKNIEQYLHYGEQEANIKEELIEGFEKNVKGIFKILEESRVIYKDNVVMQACQYVVEHIDEEITLTTISETLSISKNYFCSLFKNETGENFLSFVTRIKMKRAQFLLREENLRVYEVCDLLGYTDTTYFTRLFKKYIHMTPNEYKKVVGELND